MAATRPTREQRKAETRERLLAAATRVFARSGYHGASVDEIAEEAGFSTGAVYSNFEGKEDLFLALVEDQLAAQTRALDAAVGQLSSVAERTRGGAEHWIAFVEREPRLLLLFMD